MTWLDFIYEKEAKPVLLFSIATTGLKPGIDEIIAFSYIKKYIDGTEETGTLFKSVLKEKLLQAQEYHNISESMINLKGLSEDDFRRALNTVLKDTCCFSYNPEFQHAFLNKILEEESPYIYDLLMFLKGAEMRLCLEEKNIKDLSTAEKTFRDRLGKAPALKQMCIGRDIKYAAPFSKLPVEYNVECLQKLFYLLNNISVTVQEQLL